MGNVDRERVDDIFMAALELPASERASYVETHCGDDGELRDAVIAMLRAHDSAGDFMETPAVVAGVTQDESLIGQRIGGYTITRLIAEGGMGVVYEAEQEHPRRRVALKLIRPGYASEMLLRRFELEAEVLGRLQHPGIALIHEAGTADTGRGAQPYFAMEFVDGVPLQEYVESTGIGTRARLTLLAKVCDAVQHAHQKGIIHRDLKPGNILVTEDGEPKVVDFGVARATDHDLQITSLHTDIGQIIGTMPYMSPEQADGSSQDLDTRSDVYALGVIGYQLLAGHLPYDLRRQMLHEVARIIKEQEPPRLSTVSTTFRGDVETIIGRALEKERQRRYQTASDLASDIRRYLKDEPIVARPASLGYQLRKFAKRNTMLVGSSVTVLAVLMVSVVVISFLYAAAIDARDAAARESTIRGRVLTYLTRDLLVAVDPSQTPDEDITLRAVLNSAPSDLTTRFPDEPSVALAIHRTIGSALRSVGSLDGSRHHLDRGWSLAREHLGESDRETLDLRFRLAEVMYDAGETAASGVHFDEVLAIRQSSFGADDRDTLASRYSAAIRLRDEDAYEQASAALREVLDTQRRLLGVDDADTLATLNALATTMFFDGDYAAAAPLYREALDRRLATLGAEHPSTMVSMKNLALVLSRLEAHEEAETLYQRTYDTRARLLGPAHPRTRAVLHNLLTLYYRAGKFTEVETLYAADIEAHRVRRDELTMDMLPSMNNLGVLYVQKDRLEEAEPLLREALETRERRLGSDHIQTLMSRHHMASWYVANGQFDDAVALSELAVAGARSVGSPGQLGEFLRVHGQSLIKLARFDEAEAALVESFDLMEPVYGPRHDRTRLVMTTMQELYGAWGRPEKAAEWGERLEEMPETGSSSLPAALPTSRLESGGSTGTMTVGLEGYEVRT